MRNVNPFRSWPFRAWLLLLMGALVLLAACFARLEELGQPAQAGQAPAVAIAPTAVATQAPPVTVSPPVSSTQAITPTATLSTTYTPEPPPPTSKVGKRVNLANGTPVALTEVIDQAVQRADGTVDFYLIPKWFYLGTAVEIEARLNQALEIKPGDTIIGSMNAAEELRLAKAPSPTPLPTLPLRKRVNLAVTPVSEMIVMNVRRADGSYDEYWVPIDALKGTTAEISTRLDKLMEIKPGDERFGWRFVNTITPEDAPPVSTTTP